MAYGDQTERHNFEQLAERHRRSGDGAKDFALRLRENRRGRYVALTEYANGRSNQVVIPAASLRDIISDLQDLADAAGV